MTLAPNWSAPHLWAAQWLASLGRWNQAQLELQLGAEIDPADARIVLCSWLATNPSAEMVFRSAPAHGTARTFMLSSGADCLKYAPDQASKVDEVILAEAPGHRDAASRRMTRLLQERRWNDALAAARTFQKSFPRDPQGYIVQANAYQGLGDNHDALSVLERAPGNLDERRPIMTALARIQADLGDDTGMRNTIDRLRLESRSDTRKLMATMTLLGECEAVLGNHARALKAMREAHMLGGGPPSLARVAQLAARLGQHDVALGIWKQLCRDQPRNSTYCDAQEEILRRSELR
jgi:predicted Zn-dependent protease